MKNYIKADEARKQVNKHLERINSLEFALDSVYSYIETACSNYKSEVCMGYLKPEVVEHLKGNGYTVEIVDAPSRATKKKEQEILKVYKVSW
jgi:hypothetical protein